MITVLSWIGLVWLALSLFSLATVTVLVWRAQPDRTVNPASAARTDWALWSAEMRPTTTEESTP